VRDALDRQRPHVGTSELGTLLVQSPCCSEAAPRSEDLDVEYVRFARCWECQPT
jgi:hypothetical protein